jgi:hypothetical protein
MRTRRQDFHGMCCLCPIQDCWDGPAHSTMASSERSKGPRGRCQIPFSSVLQARLSPCVYRPVDAHGQTHGSCAGSSCKHGLASVSIAWCRLLLLRLRRPRARGQGSLYDRTLWSQHYWILSRVSFLLRLFKSCSSFCYTFARHDASIYNFL